VSRPAPTARELQILAYVADGHTNAWIGHTLRIETATVKNHLHTTYLKLGATDRTHAVVLAHRAGLLDLTGPAVTATVRSAA
jgi:DNA-binding NarL/FixJ family response regulator